MILCCNYANHLRQDEVLIEAKDQFERIEEAQTVFANADNKITSAIN